MDNAPGASGKPRRVAEKALATRAALIELAAELFSNEGYIQTSIRDIAKRGQLTTGAIYGHFRGKADLLAEAISKRTAEELEAQAFGLPEPDYVGTLTRLSYQYPKRRRLRALLVQGAAAFHLQEKIGSIPRLKEISSIQRIVQIFNR